MEHDPFDTELQDDAQTEASNQAKLRTQNEVADFKWIMSNKRGRRFVWLLLEKAGVFRLSFTGDSATTFFNEGQRNFGLRVWAMVQEHTPEAYLMMTKENADAS